MSISFSKLFFYSPDPWDGILDATKHSAAPKQNADGMKEIGEFMPDIVGEDPITFDEDCLYLSVYSRNPSKAANLPVSTLFFKSNLSLYSLYYAEVFNQFAEPTSSPLCAYRQPSSIIRRNVAVAANRW